MSIDHKDDQSPQAPQGPVRKMLRLIVESDSSRFLGHRVGASLALLGLIALFALAGYGVPALLARYF